MCSKVLSLLLLPHFFHLLLLLLLFLLLQLFSCFSVFVILHGFFPCLVCLLVSGLRFCIFLFFWCSARALMGFCAQALLVYLLFDGFSELIVSEKTVRHPDITGLYKTGYDLKKYQHLSNTSFL